MATLKLNPAVAAARRAAKAASGKPAPSAAPPTSPSASRGAFPAAQVKGLPKTEQTPVAGAPGGKAAKKQALNMLEQRLRQMWLHLFDRQNPVPLKIGIKADILPHLSPAEQKLLPAVLGRWCSRGKYQQALMEPGAHRCGLDGSIAPVSQKDAEHARAAKKEVSK